MAAADAPRNTPLAPASAECGESAGGRGWGFGWLPWILVVGVLATLIAAGWFLPFAHPTGGPPPFWPIVPFGIVLAIVVLFLALRTTVRGFGPWYGRRWSEPASAREIVRCRYARGEITAQQLREMLGDLDERSD
jgi:uncharacterized membrane protein